MSDPKRGGSRDISELKQRLGLKKAAPPSATTGSRGNAGSGGVVPPPGLPQPPAQPAIPNAAEDPFGAMNAMAAQATVQRAPEIVIVHDGKPVEHVGASRRSATIAKIAVPAVAALAVGIAIGQIGTSASLYNTGLKEMRAIIGDDKTPSTVKNVKHTLSELDGALDDLKAKNGYHPDSAADQKLAELSARLTTDTKKVFGTSHAIDRDLTADIMKFYAGVDEVKSMLDTHLKAATYDDKALAAGKAAGAAAAISETDNAALASAGSIRYGALLQGPTKGDSGDIGVQLVELGPPYCGATIAPAGKCDKGEPPSGIGYRTDPGASWAKGDLQTQGGESIPAKKLLLLLPSTTRDNLLKGSQPGASELYYVKRLATVADRTKKLIEEAIKLEQRLEAESNKSSRFSFFL